jgi:competence protein ComEC
LDVGQGSAIVLQGPRQTLVYDTGGGDPKGTNMATMVLLPYLRREGISSLDTLLVSHADNDHSAGAGALRSTLAVRQFLHGGVFPGSEGGLPCRAGQAWQWSSRIRFQILSPASGQALSSNNSSCVLQVQVGEWRLLLPGDIDIKQEQALVSYWRAKLRSDWLLAAHHGSNTSSSRLWLKYVLPAQVVFSAGYGNAFGHPHSSVIQRSREGNRSLYKTSTQGAMEFYLDAKGEVTVLPHRLVQARYWH